MEKKNRIYVAGYPGDSGKNLILDLRQRKDTVLIDDIWGGEKSIVRKLYEEYNQRRERLLYRTLGELLRRIPIVLNWFYSHYALSKVSFEEDAKNYLLLINSGLCCGYTHYYLKWLKRRIPNACFVLYIVDPQDIFFDEICRESIDVLKEFDLIYNINYSESLKYGQIYWPLILSKPCKFPEPGTSEKSDIYFCGFGSDRLNDLAKVYEECAIRNIKTKFLVYCFDGKSHEGVETIKNPISYDENLGNIANTNCMLEIMHGGYNNPTQRYSEAVIHNRKLLSNNDEIINFPYYDGRYMKIFHKVEEIDWEWVKKKEEVDYYYEGGFSPIRLVEDMIQKAND